MDTTPTAGDNDNRVAVIHCAVLEVEVDEMIRASDGVVHVVRKIYSVMHLFDDMLNQRTTDPKEK